uniref:Uncharacterized protein n=1 Tax=Strigamia maritima TaxID=126957 RepID=T1J0N3_STRMM
LLQSLGKSDKTTDEIFDEYVNNFKKQEANANKLHKEIKNYVTCVRAMQQASKSLFDTLNESYEQDWVGYDQLYMKSQTVEMLWSDFNHKLSDQVLIPLNNYQNQFAEVRKRVDKRGRKLTDYDSCRHAYQSLVSNTKKRDEAKIAKAKEQLDDARRLYEVLNNELYDELPALYDSRIPFVISNLQTIFSAEAIFHQESTNELSDIMEELAEENQKGTYNTRKIHPPSTALKGLAADRIHLMEALLNEILVTNRVPLIVRSSRARVFQNLRDFSRNQAYSFCCMVLKWCLVIFEGLMELMRTQMSQNLPPLLTIQRLLDHPTKENLKRDNMRRSISKKETIEGSRLSTCQTIMAILRKLDNKEILKDILQKRLHVRVVDACELQGSLDSKPDETDLKSNNVQNEAKRVEELYDIPVGATTENLPPGVLYRVRATYRYTAEDEDELSFEVGEVVQVIEYDDPEDQEEGWLLGMRETNDQKGLFPANFTRPI